MGFIAKNNQGLQELYQLVTKIKQIHQDFIMCQDCYEDLFDVSKKYNHVSGTNPMIFINN